MGKKKKKKKPSNYPLVSVCTPTFNRRPFIKSMIKCFMHQDYPKEHIEWIIIDDGTDKIKDLVCDIPQVKYFYYSTKLPLGKKRNIMHEKSSGEIIVYMDDDDYYPPDRISHAVKQLQSHPKALCAGSSELYIWFKHIKKMYQFGPYNSNHATAGTFAFKRELLKQQKYEDEAALAEEKFFLNNYTVPFIQLDPKKVILVFSHEHNTFDKRKLLENPHPQFVKESDKTVDDFIKDPELKDFYMNQIEDLLKNYEPGRPCMKPDVLEQIIKIEEKRRKHAENMSQKLQQENGKKIILEQPDGSKVELNNDQVVNILHQQQKTIKDSTEELKTLKIECTKLAQYSQNKNIELKKREKEFTNLQIINKNLIKKLQIIKNQKGEEKEEENENIQLLISEEIEKIKKEKNNNFDDIDEILINEINQKN